MCEFYDTQMSALLQYSAHFLESLVEVLEVSYAECCRHCIEGLIREGEVQTVFFLETDDVLQIFLFYFLSSDFHHALGYVCSDELLGMQCFCRQDGEVACTGGDVEHLFRVVALQQSDGFATPPLVDIP